ncbi:MAG: type 4a pilus biogenesis protein PilO [Candidatus Omnitrophota bacterium]
MAVHKININEQTKLMAIGIAIALLTILISYAMIRKSYNIRNSQTAKIEEEKESQVLRNKITGLYELRGKYRKYLYETEDIDVLRNNISSLALNSGIDIVSLQPLEPEKIGKYSKVSFNLRVRCSYDKLGKFIESIETYPTLTNVEELTLYSGASETERKYQGATIAEVSLLVNAYCMGK